MGGVVLAAGVVAVEGAAGLRDANSVAITGGTVNGTTIGGTTAASGAFTTVTASGQTVIGVAPALDTYEQLDLVSAGDSYMFIRNTNAQGVGNGGIIEFYQKNGNGGEVATARFFAATDSAHATAPGGRLSFWTRPNGGALTERVRIDDDGNVGIGTTGPGYKLEVSGTSDASPSTGSGIFSVLGSATNALHIGSISTAPFGMYLQSSSTSYPVVLNPNGDAALGGGVVVGGSSAGTAAFAVMSGNVGIGTTAPDKALEINSATGANLRLTYNDADGSAVNYADLSTTSVGNLAIAPSGGTTSITGVANISGNVILSKTITAPGTTGAQTINKSSGRVNFAAAATSLVVTNSLVNANSIIVAMAATNDSTGRVINVVAGAGSFTINAVAPAAEMAVNFLVTN